MRVRLRTGVEAESVTVTGKKYDSAESVGLGIGGIKIADNMLLKRTALADLSGSTDRVDLECLKCSR